ncbi:hypothetical protein [Endozoicomonas atrinae]|uniref:hypothetical protein n=1 Tax=Endozoicomonas atrinae TaxID=1333660 RepID=UPI003AFFF67F
MEDFYESAKTYLHNTDVEFSGASLAELNGHMAEMKALREKLARGLPRAKRIASIFQIPIVAHNPITNSQFNAFTTIINGDDEGFIGDSQKLDLINETIGACMEVERSHFLKVINPLYWATASISKVLRFPFWILETSGFKSESFEKGLAGSVVRLVEMILIIALLFYIGFNETELKDVIKGLVNA